jgi:hypothetical protein
MRRTIRIVAMMDNERQPGEKSARQNRALSVRTCASSQSVEYLNSDIAFSSSLVALNTA